MHRRYFKHIVIFLAMCFLLSNSTFAGTGGLKIDAGIRVQKTVYFYYENGFTIHISKKEVFDKKLFLNFSYVSSRIGTAISSNALKQDNYLFSAGWNFRPEKTIQPMARITTGFFHCNYGSDIFSDLPDKSIILCLEPSVRFRLPMSIYGEAGFGYHFIKGNGSTVPGSLFPLFFQFSLTYLIFGK